MLKIIDLDGVFVKTQAKMPLPQNMDLKKFAKKNRNAGVLSEVLFWEMVKAKKFFGIKFRKQKIIGNFIVDFFCDDFNFIVEIDGISHNEKYEYDLKREMFFSSLNLKVFKIYDEEVKQNLDGVYQGLKNFIIINYADI